MSRILCLFKLCDWQHIRGGLYQCSRCKTISIGSDKDCCTDESTNKNKKANRIL